MERHSDHKIERQMRIFFLWIASLSFCFGQQTSALPIDPSLDIRINSSKDGAAQPAIFYVPKGAAAEDSGPRVPLLVFLHSWSTDYKTAGPALEESQRRGWIFIAPDFRGPK